MKTSAFDALQTRCRDLRPAQAEVHYRGYLATNDRDLRVWTQLIECLGAQRNHVEAVRTVERLLTLRGEDDDARWLAMIGFFRNGAPLKAHRIGLLLRADGTARNRQFEPTLRLLRWLHGPDSASPPDTDASRPLQQVFHAFNAAAVPVPARGIDVGLFLPFEWHHAIQRGIADRLRARKVCCMFLQNIWEVIAARPRILIVSDALGGDLVTLRQFLPDCRIVHTRHGLGDKNYASHGFSQADLICVSSARVADAAAARSMIDRSRFWVTGYPQMDPLFDSLRRDPATPGRRTVLVAPTFTPGMNAADMLGERLVEHLRAGDASIRVMIRPHPHWQRTHGDLVRVWAGQAASLPGVSLHADPETSLMDLFAQADLLVSDVSSAGLAWLATSRPLICMVDPDRARASPFHAPDGDEWRMQAAATSVRTHAALAPAVRRALDAPFAPNPAYRALRDHLFGDLTDGRASERVAAHIIDALTTPAGAGT